MKKSCSNKTRCLLILLFLCVSLYGQAQEIDLPGKIEQDHCLVYFYPHVLNQEDCLKDGLGNNKIELDGNTVLVWVDPQPEMRFTHETLYILISKQGVRIIKGGWWPIVNGKQVLYGEKDKYAFLSPFATESNNPENINIHIYPHELYPYDTLVDGPLGNQFKIVDNTLLLWVDMLPMALFTHPTAYILISKEYTRVENGGWWPILNKRRILFGDHNTVGVISPFLLLSQHIDN